MTEPTIDEMLEWLTLCENVASGKGEITNAIRAILEQEQDRETLGVYEQAKAADLIAIRAFVDRVRQRTFQATGSGGLAVSGAEFDHIWRESFVQAELEAMESDNA